MAFVPEGCPGYGLHTQRGGWLTKTMTKWLMLYRTELPARDFVGGGEGFEPPTLSRIGNTFRAALL